MKNNQDTNRSHENLKAYATIVTVLLFLMIMGTIRFANAGSELQFGMYTHGGVWNGITPIETVEVELGTHVSVIHHYQDSSDAFDPNLLQPLIDTNRTPLITWETNSMPLAEINTGKHDHTITAWAAAAAEFGHTIHFRPFPEMNGNWTPWNGNPQALTQAWQRIHHLFQTAGATNVKFMWAPNVTDEPRTTENAMENYWPGSEYVDTLALDGFNWGDTRDHTAWLSFEDTFSPAYNRITQLHPTAPVWIAEIGSAETGGNKAQWVHDMFQSTLMPRITTIVWFNENKETDWRINSSTASLQAFRQHLSSTLANN